MDSLSKGQARAIVSRIQAKNQKLSKRELVEALTPFGIVRSSAYRILRKIETDGHAVDSGKGVAGRKRTKMSERSRKALVRTASNKIGVSVRFLAKKYGISKSYVHKILKEEGLKYTRGQKAPQASVGQQICQRGRIRALARGPLRANSDVDIIMDDETYFAFSRHEMPGNAGFYAVPDGDAPDEVKFRCIGKYPKKIMVWIAISPRRGVLKPVIIQSGTNVNGEVYREMCLRRGLLPFIGEKYPDGGYLFWPDLAAAHYACDTVQFLEEAGVATLNRDDNPTNVPQLCPI